ncbi:hypothetical protein ABB37_04618 [Leptomonas pyrrhocoris]|uniref:C2H2-type domain-containing protein n=1 Tax=Leptomonas pyrrhocoris TaxID=157538 RepID=A0A0M9G1M8_LEPPY|nr:hypothetical protein ABB37_04618 [Leptomonas pyrrhocoris]XP_015658794.1 hypothetical protein ABB37_04618 [Leptomonas pyrrhocoris]XP_015658795.1 hypothetical protein ABB37_04618 [Leptomonas pyrrhocoris]XP_015658796.1 hypothetical protein ABB37_04618 [Leptomonas pyrrhocoris]KPA80354.1 hypothetical protein ABB37_04618 [Leptomonas pyrrhocoris]KPA80355.1 hypothetical protein ABB37_04618 [Leptomonas pyrrhocoris]KPA80356.1 hypothetical protein ABB37_04618 [Leptomonas pyrrhocoris]KPA80357.1 hypot|eukprot:XP_015658793.1 hypothetical protein ABB37_04618 [Leptomonas pyrrhocoris]
MRSHRHPRPPFADVSSEVLEKAFHPFDKLVIGLPPAMASWTRAYGSATEWRSLPPNPLMPGARRPHNGGDAPPAAETAEASPSHLRGREEEGPHTQPAGRLPARPFRCDACDRDFAVEEKYEEHMKTHIYCTVPGCNFTCREHRAQQMQEHMDALHNRADAPNLADTGHYLEQRKRRFPTQEVIKGKVEELYYKAARGVVLPDERRRWLRQYGIDVGKRARTEASFIARGSLPEHSRSPSAPSDAASETSSHSSESRRRRRHDGGRSEDGEQRRSPPATRPPPLPPQGQQEEVVRPRFVQPPSQLLEDPTAPPGAHAAAPAPPQSSRASPLASPLSSSSPKQPSAPSGPSHLTKMIPLGPNGTLTPRQRVQLVRERYAAAKEVPQFYVCHRCGTKGEHWVDDCPTKGDPTYNRRVVWGEAKMEAGDGKSNAAMRRERGSRSRIAQKGEEEEQGAQRPAGQSEEKEGRAEEPQREPQQESAAPETCEVHGETPEAAPPREPSGNDNDNGEDDAPPAPQSAAPPATEPREVTRVMAPVAAARYAQPQRRDPLRRPPPPLTLYERLTEEERLNEQGVLLQAMRFFAAHDFFPEKK